MKLAENVELRARQVFRELRDIVEADWLAKGSAGLGSELVFTDTGVEFSKQLVEFKCWRSYDDMSAEDKDIYYGWELGIRILLLVYKKEVYSGTMIPVVKFDELSNQATVTCPDLLPKYLKELIAESLERNGFEISAKSTKK